MFFFLSSVHPLPSTGSMECPSLSHCCFDFALDTPVQPYHGFSQTEEGEMSLEPAAQHMLGLAHSLFSGFIAFVSYYCHVEKALDHRTEHKLRGSGTRPSQSIEGIWSGFYQGFPENKKRTRIEFLFLFFITSSFSSTHLSTVPSP
jgi:hypothetical protein